jgi:hypothetical protein
MTTQRKLTLPAVMLSACLLAGCATGTSVTDLADSSCKSFRPIRASNADTADTKRQVIGHNKAYDAVCGGAPQKVAANG